MNANLRITNALRTIFHAQAREIRATFTASRIMQGDKVNLSHWHDHMVNALKPRIMEEFKLGMAQGVRQAQRQGTDVDVRSLWNDMRAQVQADMDRMVGDTNANYAARINDVLRGLRRQLQRGKMTTNEAKNALVNHLYNDFVMASRAVRLVETETHRAVQTGKFLAMSESGFTKKTLVARNNACKKCRRLHGKTVKIDKPFWVDPAGGPYAVWNVPAFHPHCFCTVTYS